MEQQKPTFYFNGIDYNPNFYNTSSNLTNLNNYLLRIGNAISNALSTTFTNDVSINGILTTSNIKTVSPNNIFFNFNNTTTTIPTNSPLSGSAIGWNQQNYGETDFISYGAGDNTTGGFFFSCVNQFNNNQWLARITKSGIVFYKNLYIFGNTIINLTSLSTSPTYPDSSVLIATTAFVSTNFIDLTTDQINITGQKTFTTGITTSNISLLSNRQIFYNLAGTGTIPNATSSLGGYSTAWNSSNQYGEVNMISYGSAGSETGGFEFSYLNQVNTKILLARFYASSTHITFYKELTIFSNVITNLTSLTTSPIYPDSSTLIATTAFVSSNFIDLTSNQTGISGNKTYTGTNSFLTGVTMGNVLGNNVISAYNLYSNMTGGSLTIASGLTTGFLRLGSLASQLYIDSKAQLRASMNLFESQSVSSGTTLSFPLSQTVNLTSTLAHSVTLPIITSSQEGMIFNFVKTASITVVITIIAQSPNFIQYYGSLTQYSSENLLLSTGLQSTTLMCIRSGSVYIWQEQVPIYKLYSQIAALQALNQTLIGSILAFLVIPVDTYLVCDGTSYLNASYLQLWNVIGYTYGGSGLNFNVPDFRGLFMRGLGINATNTTYVGSAIGSLQTDLIKNHTHTFTFSSGSHSAGIGVPNVSLIDTSGFANSVTTSQQNITGGTETRPANQSVIYCIRYV